MTLALDAGVALRDVQDAAGHASPLTTRRYERHGHSLDRAATYTLSSYLAAGSPTPDTPPEQTTRNTEDATENETW